MVTPKKPDTTFTNTDPGVSEEQNSIINENIYHLGTDISKTYRNESGRYIGRPTQIATTMSKNNNLLILEYALNNLSEKDSMTIKSAVVLSSQINSGNPAFTAEINRKKISPGTTNTNGITIIFDSQNADRYNKTGYLNEVLEVEYTVNSNKPVTKWVKIPVIINRVK